MGKINFLISIGRWILNLISGNYIGRLEKRIESLEAENKRTKEHYSELIEISEQRRGLLRDKEEAIERREKEIGEFRQSIKQQKKQVFEGLLGLTERFFDEVSKYATLNKENRAKIENLRKKSKLDLTDIVMETFYENEIDKAYRALGEKAIDTIFEISRTIIEMMKKS
jgi:molecular chaperone DnaK (HSP70)